MSHYNVEYSRELGYISRDMFASFSLNFKYYFENNDFEIPE